MSKRKASLEVNSFIGGIVSDASPLNFPQNASISEENIQLSLSGGRSRRLGINFEEGGNEIETTISVEGKPAHTSFKWENAGGSPEKTLLVVQFGNEVKFFDFDNIILSSSVIYTHLFAISTFSSIYSYAVVDGVLVVVTGEKNFHIFNYSSGSITHSTDYIKIRDLFGVADIVDSVNLKEGNHISTRPSLLADTHIYNLRNQSFGKSVVCVTSSAADSLTKKDPIAEFKAQTGVYPSNCDTVNQALYPDSTLASNRTIDRFVVEDLDKSPIGSTAASNGYFIIDALERGASRITVYDDMMTKYPQLSIDISSLPTDRTEGGPTTVAQYSGRIWYGGFSGALIGGDSKSPKLFSYVFFSRLVQDPSDISKCYQDGDPTSKETPDLLDTDGGFIRIDEAYGIKALITARNALFVLAQNGMWRVDGGSTNGFSATNYSVSKILNKGIRGASSVVLAQGNIFLWGDDGIYVISINEYGEWVGSNFIQTTLQKFYNEIESESKEYVQGFYDSYEQNVHWIYNNSVGSQMDTYELIYNLTLKAFTINRISSVSDSLPKLIGAFESTAFRTTPGISAVISNGIPVVSSGVPVVVGDQTSEAVTREIGYICLTKNASTIYYRFCYYTDATFVDWKDYDGVGIDASGFMITGYLSGGDFQRSKDIPYLTIYMLKTETGFSQDVNNDLVPVNPSSCLIQSQWSWSNSANSNRWGSPFQAYRHSRPYFPSDSLDSFDNGFEVVSTRNKIRGSGKVVSFKFSTEPKKDFSVLGWSLNIGMNEDV